MNLLVVSSRNALVAVAVAVAVSGCGASYPRGQIVRSQLETAVYYPATDIPIDAATMPSLEQAASAQGCTAAIVVATGEVGATCAGADGTLVFGKNPHNNSVLMVACLGKITDAICEETAKRIIAARK
jgi:hypothetical protein